MSSPISFRRISKRYTRHDGLVSQVLDDFSLEIDAGELVSFVGPSGVGKSTLLHMVAGLEKPDAGAIDYLPGQSPRLGMVFQQHRLLPWLTVRRNVTIAARAAGESPELGLAMLRTMGLGDYSSAYPETLSGGQRQRVSIARAFGIRPDLILLDEPFSALDELTARKLRKMLRTLWQGESPTGILVTHNTMEACYLSDRIIVLGDRPARILDDIRLPFPHPRELDDIRLFEVNRHILQILEQDQFESKGPKG